MSSVGALVGLAFGAGLLAATAWWRDRRPLPMLERISPFVGGAPAARTRRRVDWSPIAIISRLAVHLPARVGHDDVLRQVRWAAVGAALGLLVAVGAGGGDAAGPVFLLAAAGGCAGWWGVTEVERGRRRRSQRAMLAQLPMIADLVALAVSAGASPVVALDVAATAHPGPLSDEIRRAATDSRSGQPPADALAAMIDRAGIPEVRRFVDALLLATELGTPVGEVARAQAMDIRSTARRRWTEQAARRDVAMLVPIVFLVLPSVVVLALYPGLQSLRLVVP